MMMIGSRQQQQLDDQQSLKQLPLPVGKQIWHQRQEHSSSAQAQLQQSL
jgi:hypothetical protein